MSLRERILGDKDRLGWWIVPLFVMVGLGGAVIAGSLAVVYYAQQVSSLEQETRGAREDLVGAVDEVREAADDALASISEEVSEVLRRSRELSINPNDSVEQSIGFREMAAYVRGEATLQWAEQKISSRTRRLARRQMRWFDKLRASLPEQARVEVCESPRSEKAESYMRGIIEAWK